MCTLPKSRWQFSSLGEQATQVWVQPVALWCMSSPSLTLSTVPLSTKGKNIIIKKTLPKSCHIEQDTKHRLLGKNVVGGSWRLLVVTGWHWLQRNCWTKNLQMINLLASRWLSVVFHVIVNLKTTIYTVDTNSISQRIWNSIFTLKSPFPVPIG